MLLERGFKVLWNSQEEVIWCVYFVIIHLAFVHLSVHMLYINFQKEKKYTTVNGRIWDSKDRQFFQEILPQVLLRNRTIAKRLFFLSFFLFFDKPLCRGLTQKVILKTGEMTGKLHFVIFAMKEKHLSHYFLNRFSLNWLLFNLFKKQISY